MSRPEPIHRYALRLAFADLAARDASLLPMSLEVALAHPHWGLVLRVHAKKFAHREAA